MASSKIFAIVPALTASYVCRKDTNTNSHCQYAAYSISKLVSFLIPKDIIVTDPSLLNKTWFLLNNTWQYRPDIGSNTTTREARSEGLVMKFSATKVIHFGLRSLLLNTSFSGHDSNIWAKGPTGIDFVCLAGLAVAVLIRPVTSLKDKDKSTLTIHTMQQ